MSTRTLTQETLRRLSGDRHHRGSTCSKAKIVPAPRVGRACIQYTVQVLPSCSRIVFVDEESATWLHRLTSHLPSPAPAKLLRHQKKTPLGSWLALGSSHLLCSCPFPPSHTLCLSFLCLYPHTVRHYTHSAELTSVVLTTCISSNKR
jgi:hypothetical protein